MNIHTNGDLESQLDLLLEVKKRKICWAHEKKKLQTSKTFFQPHLIILLKKKARQQEIEEIGKESIIA